jgi:flagellin-like hook-associated protein FlgL
MATDTGVLGDTQRNLTAMRASMDDTIIALKSQISSSRDVDMAMVLSSLTQVQSQLQASYQLIGTLGSLSLAKYLPGA